MADGLSLDSDKPHDVMTTSTEDDDGESSEFKNTFDFFLRLFILEKMLSDNDIKKYCYSGTIYLTYN